jgi:hypothetical protein
VVFQEPQRKRQPIGALLVVAPEPAENRFENISRTFSLLIVRIVP